MSKPSKLPVTFANFLEVTLVIFLTLDKLKLYVAVFLLMLVKLWLKFSLTWAIRASLYMRKQEHFIFLID